MTGTLATASYDGFDHGLCRPAGPRPPATSFVGWLSLVQWCEAADGSPHLSVQIGLRELRHHYQLSWHSSTSSAWPTRQGTSQVCGCGCSPALARPAAAGRTCPA